MKSSAEVRLMGKDREEQFFMMKNLAEKAFNIQMKMEHNVDIKPYRADAYQEMMVLLWHYAAVFDPTRGKAITLAFNCAEWAISKARTNLVKRRGFQKNNRTMSFRSGRKKGMDFDVLVMSFPESRQPGEEGSTLPVDAKSERPDEEAERNEFRVHLREAIRSITSARARMMCEEVLLRGDYCNNVSRRVGISMQRGQQLFNEGKRKIRAYLESIGYSSEEEVI